MSRALRTVGEGLLEECRWTFKTYGSDNDEEVLYDEIYYVIGIAAVRKNPSDITDDFHKSSNEYGDEVPCSIAGELVGMAEGGEREEDDCYDT